MSGTASRIDRVRLRAPAGTFSADWASSMRQALTQRLGGVPGTRAPRRRVEPALQRRVGLGARAAERGLDRWVQNPTPRPLRFAIQWHGSHRLAALGLRDAYRTHFPDEVAKPGITWTPPYPARPATKCWNALTSSTSPAPAWMWPTLL